MRKTFLFLFLIPVTGFTQLQPAAVFSDHMVLPRDKPVPIWGKGYPGSKITVTFGQQTAASVVRPDSAWTVVLPPQKANASPRSLIIRSGKTEIIFRDVLAGDIWLCIGQSNMEWPVMKELHYQEERKHSDQALLRFYNPAYAGKNIFGTTFTDSVARLLLPDKFYNGAWQACDSNTFKTMSAVAYYFGKQVARHINVPIGLINLSIGGAPLETFIDLNALSNNNRFSSKTKGDWLLNEALPVWVRERGAQNTSGVPAIPADANGKNHAYKPGFAFAAGIEPLLPFPVKGILCYQGESNAQENERVNEYAALSVLMVNDYRKKWKQPKLPFYYVQLSSIDTVKYKGHLWPQFRDGQRQIMQLVSYNGMAVSSDIGAKDDVHPTNKKEVGERLARWALNKTYRQNIIPSGPLPLSATYAEGKVILAFQYVAKGLKTSDGKPIRGFSADGKNELPAGIGVRGVIIYTGIKPEHIYYGWKPYTDANLVNSEGLPASGFKIKVQ